MLRKNFSNESTNIKSKLRTWISQRFWSFFQDVALQIVLLQFWKGKGPGYLGKISLKIAKSQICIAYIDFPIIFDVFSGGGRPRVLG